MEQVINNFLICRTTALVCRLPLIEVKQYMFFNRRSVCVYPNYLNSSKYALYRIWLHKLMMVCSETVSAKLDSIHILSASLLFEIPVHRRFPKVPTVFVARIACLT